jgi:hypothetical protein
VNTNQATLEVEDNLWERQKAPYITTKIKHPRCISDLHLSQLSDGTFSLYICAGLYDGRAPSAQHHSERNREFSNALIATEITHATPGCISFPDENTETFLITGDARSIQNVIVQVIEVIKQLEGNQVFNNHEEMLLNLIPSITPGMQRGDYRP